VLLKADEEKDDARMPAGDPLHGHAERALRSAWVMTATAQWRLTPRRNQVPELLVGGNGQGDDCRDPRHRRAGSRASRERNIRSGGRGEPRGCGRRGPFVLASLRFPEVHIPVGVVHHIRMVGHCLFDVRVGAIAALSIFTGSGFPGHPLVGSIPYVGRSARRSLTRRRRIGARRPGGGPVTPPTEDSSIPRRPLMSALKHGLSTRSSKRLVACFVSSISIVMMAMAGCSASSSKASGSAGVSSGDHFFDGVATITGATSASSFTLAIAIFDPKYAANHPAGTPGSNSNIQEVAGTFSAPGGQTVSLDGVWSDSGTLALQGSGWTFAGTIATNVVTGSFEGSGGGGLFAGADIVSGAVSVYVGTQNGAAFDLVVLQQQGGARSSLDGGADGGAPMTGSGIVTGVIGGTTGGFITGTESGGSLSYSWQANGSNGTGTSNVATAGGLTGTSQSASCSSSAAYAWSCDVYNPGGGDPYACACSPVTPPIPVETTSTCVSPAGSWMCCELDTADPLTPNVQTCNCWSSTTDCQTYGGTGFMAVPNCPSGPLPGGSTSTCSQPWQAAPAPASPWADYAGTCAAGNLAACTPPPGGCTCPAQQGCQTCGEISACCLQ